MGSHKVIIYQAAYRNQARTYNDDNVRDTVLHYSNLYNLSLLDQYDLQQGKLVVINSDLSIQIIRGV
jgi:hypothetical protein